jgi:hypothetical protein
MRLVAIGILAAAILGAGCALQAGDPGDPGGTSTGLTPARTIPGIGPAGVGSADPAAPNPEPSPWVPSDPGVGMDDDSTGASPEPSPWNPNVRSGGADTPDPQGGSAAGANEGTTNWTRAWNVRGNPR